MNFFEEKKLNLKQENKSKKDPEFLHYHNFRKNSYDFAEKVNKLAFNGKKVVFLGVAGGQASGKTKIVSYLNQHLKKSDCLPEKDFFILGDKKREISKEDEFIIQENSSYDLKRRLYLIDLNNPQSYDYEKFYQALKDLSDGKKVTIPTFNEEKMEFSGEKVIDPVETPLIIVDGYFIFKNQKIRDMLNLKVFKEVEDDVRLSRLILREEKYLGKNKEAYELYFNLYERFYKRTFDEFIAPFKKLANILLPDYSIDENDVLEDDDILKLIVFNLNYLFKK